MDSLKEHAKKFGWVTAFLIATGVLTMSFAAQDNNMSRENFINAVEKMQEAHFRATGEYLQVRSDGTIPDDMATTANRFSNVHSKRPAQYRINVFQRPDGTNGYRIEWYQGTTTDGSPDNMVIDKWGSTTEVWEN